MTIFEIFVLLLLSAICYSIEILTRNIRSVGTEISSSLQRLNFQTVQQTSIKLEAAAEAISEIRDKYCELEQWEPGEKVAVRTLSSTEDKVKVIALIRKATGLGLTEVKNLVDSSPGIVFRGSKNKAQKLVSDLQQAGVRAELTEFSQP